jgi:hypothetical protein
MKKILSFKQILDIVKDGIETVVFSEDQYEKFMEMAVNEIDNKDFQKVYGKIKIEKKEGKIYFSL